MTWLPTRHLLYDIGAPSGKGILLTSLRWQDRRQQAKVVGAPGEDLLRKSSPYLIDINDPIEENLAYWATELEDERTDVALYGTTQDKKQVGARKLFDEARELSEAKNYTNAMAKLEEAIVIDPAYTPPWELLGRLYWQEGEIDHAIEIWNQIISIDDSLYRIHNLLGQAYSSKGDFGQAVVHYEKSNEIRPKVKA